MNDFLQTAPKTYARYAGLLYILIAIAGGFSMGYVPSVIMADGNALETVNNILANQGLVRLGILGDIIVFLCEIALSVMLFRLLKPIGETMSLTAALARIGMAVIIAVNAILDTVPLILLSDASYLEAFEAAQLHALVMVFIELEANGVMVWQMFFGLHLAVMAYLVMKSGYFPKILGLMMLVGSFGYTLQSLTTVIALDVQILSWLVVGLLVVVTIGEISFAFWLLIKGLNVDVWNKRINALGMKS